jgi:SAM-dependent methyltransferase
VTAIPSNVLPNSTREQIELPQSEAPRCRFCRFPLSRTFVDLGATPLCESFLSARDVNGMEPFYPLHAYVCSNCYLVQVPAVVSAREIFTEYAYFSSFSDAWLEHAREYTEAVIGRFHFDKTSRIVEIASNDGYLLQWFVKKGMRVLGIEPAANIAKVAQDRGVPTLPVFFDEQSAMDLVNSGEQADLLIANNVLAQIPELNGFVRAMKLLLKANGVITVEVPHLMRLIEDCQFDTIYHEHFSYFSFTMLERLFAAHHLTIFDVEEIWSHGGSLRVYVRHSEDNSQAVADRVTEMRVREEDAGLGSLDYYSAFDETVKEVKRKLLACLIEIKRSGKRIAAYGAPGKSTTLLTYCGIRGDFIDYAVDRSPYKHGKFTPGTRIPIYPTGKVRETKPDYLLILPWNLKREIIDQMSFIQEWGGRFIIPIPEATIC